MTKTIKNWFFYISGIGFLILSNIKYHIRGYTPKPFTIKEAQRCIDYDFQVVDNWVKHLHSYDGETENAVLENKRILELGPGSDLGAGLYLLSKNAKEYNAVDIYNLVDSVPDEFYELFFSNLQNKKVDTAPLVDQLKKTRQGNSDKLNFFLDEDFDIKRALGDRKIDVVFSNAAFEHFHDIKKTIKDVSEVSESGAKFIIDVDLKTHSRWIRDYDPLNIYRYPKWLYDLLSVPATPNRARPYEYKEALEKNGWQDIEILGYLTVDDDKYSLTKNHLNKKFMNEKNQMKYLSILVFATKS